MPLISRISFPYLGEPFYEETQVICPKAIPPEEGSPHQSSEIRRSISYVPDAKRVLPFSSEVISSLPTFCFPSGGYIFKEKQEAEISQLVLTNMEGLRTYAVCLTFTRPFMVVESVDEEGTFSLTNANSADSSPFCSDGKMSVLYVPICICLVSLYPYINTLKDCLSSLVPQVNNNTADIWRPLMKLSTIVTSIPVPPAGPLSIKFDLFGAQHTICPADEADRRVVDVDLHLPLLVFTPQDIVKIISCLLTQQRMIFMASSYPMITLIIEAFFTYIDPIKWRLTYVPVLPISLGDLIEAPGPFIMGVHSSLKYQVKQIRKQVETPSIVLIDIDKGLIDIDEKCPVPPMPDIVAQSLAVRLKKASPHYELKLVSIPSVFTYEELLQQRLNLVNVIKADIKDAFLDMLVSLFGDIFNFMSVGEGFFDKDAYLQSRHEDERTFFIEVTASDSFDRFVEDRIDNHQRRDAFAMLGERLATQRKSPSRSRSSSLVNHIKQSTNLPIFQKHCDIFTMPTLLEESLTTGNFYQVYCDSLTKQLEQVHNKSISLKASYLYLRGFAHFSCGEPIEGLRDFHALYSSAPELFPKEYAAEVVAKLTPILRDQLHEEAFYKQTAMFRTFTNKEEHDRRRNGSRKLPSLPIKKDDFEKRVKTFKIAFSSELIGWLFSLLTEDDAVVMPELFTALYKSFTDIEKHSENREVAGVQIETKDRILKVSPLISTMDGMGRIVLTTNVLYFVSDGARKYKIITPLCDIKEIIKYQHSSVFWSGVKALRIINSGKCLYS